MIFCHCPFVEFMKRNRLMFMVEFQELHFAVAFWTLKGIITKRQKKELPPCIKVKQDPVL